jgi:Type II site-specific deoxyribonuclease
LGKTADDTDRQRRLKTLLESLSALSESQLAWTEGVIKQFQLKPELHGNPDSDLTTECVLEMFGDALQIHHCFSREALSKDRFEYAFCAVLNKCLVPATLADKSNPGHDITIEGVPFSLKTQANRNISARFLHISKFMELGKGKWEVEEDLVGLRDRYFEHMKAYKRVLQLRRLTDKETLQVYELVEIPKKLLTTAKKGKLVMMTGSRQRPKPGTCTVTDKTGNTIFELYFDGGTERKLQIRHLDKRYCIVHAVWKIMRIPLTTEVV